VIGSMKSESERPHDYIDSSLVAHIDDRNRVDSICGALGVPDRYVGEDVAAEILGMSKAWLRRIRWSGAYPELEYVKYGSAVRYSLHSLYAFAKSRTVKNKVNE
jgi:hypothetical protein